MEMKFRQSMVQTQRLVMTPKLQQALKLLQVPTLELEQILKQEMMQNPLLEEIELEDEEEEREAEADEYEDGGEEDGGEEKEKDEPVDWDEYFEDGFTAANYHEHDPDEDDDRIERIAAAPESGYKKLLDQLKLSIDDDLDFEIGDYLIGSLNDDGFLSCSIEEVARVLDVSEERVEQVLAVIQDFDPPGIGARNLRESLLLQLAAYDNDDGLAALIVRDHFEELKNRKFTEIARELRITPAEVQAVAAEIGHLDPRPGLSTFGEDARPVTPDLIVEKVEGEYVVYLNDTNIPRLRVSRAYRDELSRGKGNGSSESDRDTREFIVNKLNSAKWLIQTIEQRRRTIVKVMQCIVEEQREFFEKGAEALRPLTLQQVANRIGMHESTVSRVTTNKYVQTPRGVFELKYFFSSSLDTDDGENVSSKAAKAFIRKIIDREDKKKPLSDQKIVDMLKEEGLNIARRTVAKYREQLEILPARLRKLY